MTGPSVPAIRIAAALVEDGAGRLLLVRKAGTHHFMQPGGKIEPHETAVSALWRELAEEIGLQRGDAPLYLGRFVAPAANEPGCIVDADVFLVRTAAAPMIGAEIAEAVWVDLDRAVALPLAPLTRDRILPLARTIRG